MFVRAAALADVPPGALRRVTLPGGAAVCLANVAGALCAFADACPHAAFPLSAGELGDDGAVLCTWHGARFDARTGRVLGGPAPEPLLVYHVRVADGEILVGPQRDTTP